MSNANEQRTTEPKVEVVKVADYWRVMVGRVLKSSHRTKAEAVSAARKWKGVTRELGSIITEIAGLKP